MGQDVSVEGGQPAPGGTLQGQQQKSGYLGGWFGGGAAPAQGGGGGGPVAVMSGTDKKNARASIYVENLGRGNTLRINVGQEVEAQYDEDGLWYRARICKFQSAQQIEVEFTQYHNTQWCGIGQLRPVVAYTEGMEVEAMFLQDKKWYPAKVIGKEGQDTFKVLFIGYGNEQLCDRSILRPQDKEIKRAIKEEIKRQSMLVTGQNLEEQIRQAGEEMQREEEMRQEGAGSTTTKTARELRKEQRMREQMNEMLDDVPDEKQAHPEDPVFVEGADEFGADVKETVFEQKKPGVWTPEEDAALKQYVDRNWDTFEEDHRAGAFWRKAEKEITTVHRTWTQMKNHYCNDLYDQHKIERENKDNEEDEMKALLEKKKTPSSPRGAAATTTAKGPETLSKSANKVDNVLSKSGTSVAMKKLEKLNNLSTESVMEESMLFGSDDEDEGGPSSLKRKPTIVKAAAPKQVAAAAPKKPTPKVEDDDDGWGDDPEPEPPKKEPAKKEPVKKETPVKKEAPAKKDVPAKKETPVKEPAVVPPKSPAAKKVDPPPAAAAPVETVVKKELPKKATAKKEAPLKVVPKKEADPETDHDSTPLSDEALTSFVEPLSFDVDVIVADKDPFDAVRALLSEASSRLMRVQSVVGGTGAERLERLRNVRRKNRERVLFLLSGVETLDAKIARLEEDISSEGENTDDDSDEDAAEAPVSADRQRAPSVMSMQMEHQKKAMAALAAAKKQQGGASSQAPASAPEPQEEDEDPSSRKRVATALASELGKLAGGKALLKKTQPREEEKKEEPPQEAPRSPFVQLRKVSQPPQPQPEKTEAVKMPMLRKVSNASDTKPPVIPIPTAAPEEVSPRKNSSAPAPAKGKIAALAAGLKLTAGMIGGGGGGRPPPQKTASLQVSDKEEGGDGKILVDDATRGMRKKATLRRKGARPPRRGPARAAAEEEEGDEGEGAEQEGTQENTAEPEEEESGEGSSEEEADEEAMERMAMEMKKAKKAEEAAKKADEAVAAAVLAKKAEEAARKKRELEDAAARKKEDEERKRSEAEEAKRKKREEEDRKRQEEELARRKKEEEERRRLDEERERAVAQAVAEAERIAREKAEKLELERQELERQAREEREKLRREAEALRAEAERLKAEQERLAREKMASSSSPPTTPTTAAPTSAPVAATSPVLSRSFLRGTVVEVDEGDGQWAEGTVAEVDVLTGRHRITMARGGELNDIRGDRLREKPIAERPLVSSMLKSRRSNMPGREKSKDGLWAPGMMCEAVWVDDGEWYPAKIVERGSFPNTWKVFFTQYGNEQDATTPEMIRAAPSATPSTSAVAPSSSPVSLRLSDSGPPVETRRVSRRSLMMAAGAASSLTRIIEIEQSLIECQKQISDAAEEAETKDSELRLQEGNVVAEIARLDAMLTALRDAPDIAGLQMQVEQMQAELQVLSAQEKELAAEQEALLAKQRERERELKKKDEEMKRKRREEERLWKEKERERKAEEERIKREKERQRRLDEEKRQKQEGLSSRKAEELRLAIEAEEARLREEEERRRKEEEEEEQRREEEERQLLLRQQELLRQEELRKKKREEEAAALKQRQQERHNQLNQSQAKRLQLDSLMDADDMAELDALMKPVAPKKQLTPAAQALQEMASKKDLDDDDDVAPTKLDLRNDERLDDSFLEDHERDLAAFLAKRGAGGVKKKDEKDASSAKLDMTPPAAKKQDPPKKEEEQKPPSTPEPQRSPKASLLKNSMRAIQAMGKAPSLPPGWGPQGAAAPPAGGVSPRKSGPELSLPQSHNLDDDGVEVFKQLSDICEKWKVLPDDRCLTEGPGLYEDVKAIKDSLLKLNQKFPQDMAPAVAAWRTLNKDMPARINALRVSQRKK